MKPMFNAIAKLLTLMVALTICAFSVNAAVPLKVTYKFDYDAPRDINKVTEEVCVQVGHSVYGVSQLISRGDSNEDIQIRLYNAVSKHMDDKDGLIAVTMFYTVIDQLRNWPQAEDYQRLSVTFPEANRHTLYQLTGKLRCRELIGTEVKTPKVVRTYR